MNVTTSIYKQILKEVIEGVKERSDADLKKQAIFVDYNTTIVEQNINKYEFYKKQIDKMKEDGKLSEDMYAHNMKQLEAIPEAHRIVPTRYLRLWREGHQEQWHKPTENLFVDGFKYQRLENGEWINKEWNTKKEGEFPSNIDNTFRYMLKMRIKDVLYMHFVQMLPGEESRLKARQKADAQLMKSMIHDLVGIGLQWSASEILQQKTAKEQEMIKKHKDEILEQTTDNTPKFKVEKGGSVETLAKTGEAGNEIITDSARAKESLKAPIDEQYKKDMEKARQKAGVNPKGSVGATGKGVDASKLKK